MPTPGKHKTVQSPIIAYAQDVRWPIVPRKESERRRRFDPDVPAVDRTGNRQLFCDDLMRKFIDRWS